MILHCINQHASIENSKRLSKIGFNNAFYYITKQEVHRQSSSRASSLGNSTTSTRNQAFLSVSSANESMLACPLRLVLLKVLRQCLQFQALHKDDNIKRQKCLLLRINFIQKHPPSQRLLSTLIGQNYVTNSRLNQLLEG